MAIDNSKIERLTAQLLNGGYTDSKEDALIRAKHTIEESDLDQNYTVDIPECKLVSHSKWQNYIHELGNKPGMRILEIGSRDARDIPQAFSNAEYVGFDYYPGKNVDIVGDAHKLSSYFKKEEKFDIIYSAASFEHFAMPWLVAIEIAKLLKVGGVVFVESHFTYGYHGRPWNFFNFTHMGLKVLFSKALGFDCLAAGMSNPVVGRFSSMADDRLKYQPLKNLMCHSEYLGKKVSDVPDFSWDKVDLIDVVEETKYPEP